ncbi:phage tail fiber C-terminal domain-containing protein, partial [Escherichia coli]
ADKKQIQCKQIQCVVRPLQILRADGTWENIGGMK